MSKKILTLTMLFLLLVTVFSLKKEAIEYYQAGLNAYQQENYKEALNYFEKALITDPSIEGYDSSLKFKAGISAFMIGNYEKAKAYLSNYEDNPFANELLESIHKNSTTTVAWNDWINKYKYFEPSLPQETTSKKSNSKLILFLITFSSSFTIFLIMELRVVRAKRLSNTSYVSNIGTSNNEENINTQTSKIIFENEEDLIPENSRVVDFNELITKDLSFLSEFVENNNESTDVLANDIVIEKENEEQNDESLEEVLNEIDEIEEIVSNKENDDESKKTFKEQEQNQKNETENFILKKLDELNLENNNQDNEPTIDKVEEFSSMDIDEIFSKLDKKDKFDEYDLKILSEKLQEYIFNTNEKE